MRTFTASALLSLLAIPCGKAAIGASPPPNHPSVAMLAKFSPHISCPYAEEWMVKGPHQAALDLGLLNHTVVDNTRRRRTQTTTTTTIMGSCSYKNAFSGQETCVEMRGDKWGETAMGERCEKENDSTLAVGSPCSQPSDLAGWCITGEAGSIEATPMPVADMGCEQVQTLCETFVSGTFEAADMCESGGVASEEPASGGMPAAIPADGTCALAPGPIGGGHMAGWSNGYTPTCEGTPAEGSPYMWPMAWAANVERKSMPAGSDGVVYHGLGKNYFRSDKNWKRQDWWYQRGVQRAIGQPPCAPENDVTQESDGPAKACQRDSDEITTLIHRGGKMIYISWQNDTVPGSHNPSKITECSWLDMAVIGNIRPDWFMDARGTDVGVQYLGNQHIVHENEPRLVKQWRKKDFVEQYFVMSMLANPDDDGVHWPMMLNIPGEGFGDDILQIYSNHSLLTDDDDHIFLIDEAFVAMGGTCEEIVRGGGPPAASSTNNADFHIPSNLEVEPHAWFSNEYTFSPVWVPPEPTTSDMPQASSHSSLTGEIGIATTEVDHLVVKSCFDPDANAVEFTAHFADFDLTVDDQLPWMGLGYRETEECLMTPADGGSTDIIVLAETPSAAGMEAYFGAMPSATKAFDDGAINSIYASLIPLEEKEAYSSVSLNFSTMTSLARSAANADSVTLHYKQRVEGVPDAMHLMYAIGTSTEVTYHKHRGCIDITEFPTCPSSNKGSQATTRNQSLEESFASRAVTGSAYIVAIVSAAVLALM